MEETPINKIGTGCAPTVHLRPRRYCDHGHATVQSRRKYIFTDQIDQLIRESYLNHRDAKRGFGIRPLAKKVGMPHWALKKRARELGLARTKERPWSEPELAILSRYAWLSDERIRLKLKAAGCTRTLTRFLVSVKRKRRWN